MDGTVPPIGDGGYGTIDEEKELLSAIIKVLNETYGVNLSDDDKIDVYRIQSKLEANDELRAAFNADNTREAKEHKFQQVFDDLLLEFVNTKLDLYKKLTEPKVNKTLKRQLYDVVSRQMSAGV